MFKPILIDQPLSYAEQRPQFFRNIAREKAWGLPVYFVPADLALDYYGQPGPGYETGKPYNISQGKYGNCTWWIVGRCHEVTGHILTECIGDADDMFRKYSGRKDGGNFNGVSIGNKVLPGDILIWADNTELSGPGHVNFVEDVDNEYVYISESGYSKNELYKEKACITYKLKLSDLITGRRVTLRPKSPYSELFYGVIHTSDFINDWDEPKPVEKDETKDQLFIGNTVLNVRNTASTESKINGQLIRPNALFNVVAIENKDDYTWYCLGNNSWVAGVEETEFFKASKKEDIEELKKQINAIIKELQKIVDNIK